ncbi:MAG: hypothetical protein J5647_10730 [Spirochaetaceae bacterium]|nr:hypothetical protein [Spirochaetaceae bacterium]
MKKKVSDFCVKYLSVFTVLCFFCVVLVSCDFGNLFDPTFDDSFEEYLDYWASTCQVGEIEYVSSHVTMDDGENLSAQDKIELEILVINPKEYNLLCKNGGGNCFSFRNEAGNLAYSEYTEEVVNPSKIKITARLTDASEGQRITLSGCLWPENTSNFTEESLRQQNNDLFYDTSFIQNTPPDGVRNVYVPPYTMNNKHYVSFEIPDQTKNKNKGVKFEVQYFLRENDGLNFKGSKVLSLSDSKTPGNIFTYYFDEQEDFLAYEYSVKVWGGRGLSIEQVSTDPGLGVHVMVEPTITFGTPFTGHTDAQGYEYIEVSSGSATVSYTISSDEAGAVLSGNVDGVPYTGAQNGTLAVGAHTLVATVHKDMCRDVTVTRKIMVAQSMNGATLTFTGVTYGNTDTNGYRYYEVNTNSDVVPYSIVATEAGVSLAGTVDGISFSGSSSGNLAIGEHTLVATVSRENYNDVMVTEKIMVVKKLAPAVLTFTPTFNGCGTDDEDYEYIEVATSSATVSYGIAMPESGTTITGTIDGSAFSGVQSDVFAIGSHTITATIHRDYYHDITVTKNVMVVKKLDAPTIGITGTTYGNTDGVYTYYEVSSANGTVGYTITSESGTTITGSAGTSYSTTGTSTENEKTGTLGINTTGYEITATAHKPYHLDSEPASMKIQVVKKLEAPNIEFEGTTYNNIDDEGFKYYEVSSADGKIVYTIASENGTTITSSLGNVSTHIKEGELGIESYEITATAHKPYHHDSAATTKKIKVVRALQEPTMSFYSNSERTNTVSNVTPYDSNYNSWACYDITLDNNGNGSLYYTFEAQDSGAILSTAESGSPLNNSSSFAIGPHTITLTVSKQYYEPKTFTRNIYVEGVLSDAVVTSTLSPGVTTTNSGSLQFSYLNYNEMSVSVSAGNSGNTISSVTAGGASKGTSFSLAHGFNGNVVVVQTRTYCKAKTTTRSYAVTIKPVTAYVPTDQQMYLNYDDDDELGSEGELYGTVYLGKNGDSWTAVRTFENTDFKEHEYERFNHSAWSCVLYSPSDSVSFKTEGMYEDDTTGDDEISEVNTSKALSALKGYARIEITSNAEGRGGECVHYKIDFSLSE